MTEYERHLNICADILTEAASGAKTAIILGSGLGDYGDSVADPSVFHYKDLPGFPLSTVAGHAGKLIIGSVENKKILVMCGRFHYYEGYSMQQIVFPIRVMKKAGIENLILTNAAGGINLDFHSGCLMMITDHINLSGSNPLIGQNLDEFGPRFPDMTYTYCPELQTITENAASSLGIPLKKGVYCMLSGPCYETPAEIRMLRTLGADAVGMSTVPEAIAAHHAGMKVLGISCITNMAAGITSAPLNHQEVIDTGLRVRSMFSDLITAILLSL